MPSNKTIIEQDEEMKRKIREELGKASTASASHVHAGSTSQPSSMPLSDHSEPNPSTQEKKSIMSPPIHTVDRDAELKNQIKEEMKKGKTVGSIPPVDRDAELKKQIKEEMNKGKASEPIPAVDRDAELKKQIKEEMNKAKASKPIPAVDRDAELKKQIKEEMEKSKPLASESTIDHDHELKNQIRQEMEGGKLGKPEINNAEQGQNKIRQDMKEEVKLHSDQEKDEQLKNRIREEMNKGRSSNGDNHQDGPEFMAMTNAEDLNPQTINSTNEAVDDDDDAAIKKRISIQMASDRLGAISSHSSSSRQRISTYSDSVRSGATGDHPSLPRRIPSTASSVELATPPPTLNGQESGFSATASLADSMHSKSTWRESRAESLRVTAVAAAPQLMRSVDINTDPSSLNSKGREAMETSDNTDLSDELRPGAVAVGARAYGNVPAWGRSNTRTSGDSSQVENSNIPPEMRGVIASTDQNHLPPEMRVAIPNDESLEQPAEESYIPTAEVRAVPIEEMNKSGVSMQKPRTWIYVLASLAVICIAIGVGVGVALSKSGESTSGESDLDASLIVPTRTPTGAPTIFSGFQCLGFDGLPSYVDPNIDNLTADAFDVYERVVTILRSRGIDYQSPETEEEYCNPSHLAIMWASSTVDTSLMSDQSLWNQVILATLYFSWKGEGDSQTWLDTADECTWEGVQCAVDGTIIGLSLHLQLIGNTGDSASIPTFIGLLTGLQSLRLQRSQLTGTVPTEIGLLTDMILFDLSGNQRLSGTFPFDSITGMTSLRALGLSRCGGMKVDLPTTMRSWSNLEVLALAESKIGIGEVPTDMSSLSNLRFLDLSASKVLGFLDQFVGLDNLEFLGLSKGDLEGSIPSDFANMSNLQWLLLNGNLDVSGTIPNELESLSMLSFVQLQNLPLVGGTIPDSLLQFTSLTSFGAGPNLDGSVNLTISESSNLVQRPNGCLGIGENFISSTFSTPTCTKKFDDGLDLQTCEAMKIEDCTCCSINQPGRHELCQNISKVLTFAQCDIGRDINIVPQEQLKYMNAIEQDLTST